MPKVEFETKHGVVTFNAKPKRKKSTSKLNDYQKLVRKVSRDTGLSGPALMKAASAEYRKKSSVSKKRSVKKHSVKKHSVKKHSAKRSVKRTSSKKRSVKRHSKKRSSKKH